MSLNPEPLRNATQNLPSDACNKDARSSAFASSVIKTGADQFTPSVEFNIQISGTPGDEIQQAKAIQSLSSVARSNEGVVPVYTLTGSLHPGEVALTSIGKISKEKSKMRKMKCIGKFK
jgi:hypothetical protein